MDRKPTILCVDDDPFFGELYRQALEPKGYDVAVAQDAPEGFEMAKSLKPDLIILDVMMPEKGGFKDGFELLDRLRHEGPCTTTPIVMISAIGGPDDVRHGKSLGATDYLAKQNMVPENLLALVKKLVSG
ncbi:MAG: hypothetical protein RL272_1249 [Candidatus Parcubacteria bacterium]|jgi:CheY-like chemotaxis protein